MRLGKVEVSVALFAMCVVFVCFPDLRRSADASQRAVQRGVKRGGTALDFDLSLTLKSRV